MTANRKLPALHLSRCAVLLAVAFLASALAGADTTHLYIVGTNDIHGALAPHVNATSSEGGLALLTGYVDALRAEHPGHVIWLDAGDEFQGSIESNSEEGEPVVEALNAAGVTAAAIGNHEFDFGPAGPDDSRGDPLGALRARIAEAKYPFLSANITLRSTGHSPFGDDSASILRTFDGIRVGIIGLTTPTTATSTWPLYVRDLAFGDMREAAVREAAKLRERGAEVVIALAHSGIRCDHDACSGEIADFVRTLPHGTVDAVISGHSHTIVATVIEGVPVVQAGSKAEYLNIIDLPFDRTTRRVVSDQIRIEGPIAVRSPGQLHGTRVKPDRTVERLLRPVFKRVAPLRDRVLATSDQPLRKIEDQESAMGDLVADALHTSSGADFAMINAGGVRAGLPAGKITYGNVFESVPFENKIVVLSVTGSELKTILRVAESGAIGYFPVSGLRVTINSCQRCPADDLDGDGRAAQWETNRLVDVVRSDNTPIRDDAEYSLATVDFLVLGGDYMGWPIGRVPPDRVRYMPILLRDALATLLKTRRHLDTSLETAVADPARARMIFVRRDVADSAATGH